MSHGVNIGLANSAGVQRGDVGRSVLRRMGRAMGTFSMLVPGDRVGVGVSGGKDSLCLALALAAYQKHAPFKYDLVALTIDQGKFTSSVRPLGNVFRGIGVPWIVRKESRTLELVSKRVAHGCDVCSRNRRGALYEVAEESGCTVLALGHTADDCAEALFRNVLFNGRIASLPPVARSRKGSMRVIRPLVYVTEDETLSYVEAMGVNPVGCVCQEKAGPRKDIRAFLESLHEKHPGIRESVMSALANVTPYTLSDPELHKWGADIPAFAASLP